MSQATQLFWSYAHLDDERSGGRVTSLARQLSDEYGLITGSELEIFLDRDSIEWGNIWRERIDDALGEAPLFVAILTPQYLASDECRRELLAFSAQSKGRRLEKLLLPIYYIDVDGVSEDSDDELRATIARTQWFDWRKLRLKSPSAEEVALGLNAMAERVAAVVRDSREKEFGNKVLLSSEPSLYLDEALQGISANLGTWLDAVEFDHLAGKQWNAAIEERGNRIQRLRQGRAGSGPELGVLIRLGGELLPIAQNRLEKAKDYLRQSVTLDPFVAAAVRVIQTNPSMSDQLALLVDGVLEAHLNIEPPSGKGQYDGLPRSWLELSRPLHEAWQTFRDSQQYVGDANDIVIRWYRELCSIGLIDGVVDHATDEKDPM